MISPASSTFQTKQISSFLRQSAIGLDVLRLSDREIAGLIVAPPSAECPRGSRVGDAVWHFEPSHYPHMSPTTVCVDYRGRRDGSRSTSLTRGMQRFNLSVILAPLTVQPDLSSLRQRAHILNRVADWLFDNDFDRFGSLPMEQLPRLWAHMGKNWRSDHTWQIFRKILFEMEQQARRGFLTDALPWADPLDPASLAGELRSYHQNPSLIYDAPERPIVDQTDEDGDWIPLSDEWVQAAGFRWIYLLKNILPNLIRIAKDWDDLNLRSKSRSKAHRCDVSAPLTSTRVKDLLNEKRRAYLASFDWKDANNKHLEKLPFTILGTDRLPVLWTDLQRLISCVQKSLYSLLLLLTAGRRSEVGTLKQSGSLIEIIDPSTGMGSLNGRTYKLSGFSAGDDKTWPIPAVIAKHIEDWSAVVKLTHPGNKHLWVSWSSKPNKRPALNTWPNDLNRLFELEVLAGDVKVHAHRFRKTMARLAVLCLVGAPMILMQILGHESLVTTLKYIFSDPHIRDELSDVLQELRLEIAIVVAEGLDESGGRGAKALKKAREGFIEKLKLSSNERAQRFRARDFAAAHLADGGVDLKVIFAGIICIKPGNLPGRCSRNTLEADISRCEAECPYFLALPTARDWIRTTLEWLIAELEDEVVRKNDLLAPFYQAQFVDQARTFDSLRLEYLEDLRVRALLPPALLKRLASPL